MSTDRIRYALEKLRELLLVNDYAILIDLFTNGRINNAPWMSCPANMVEKLPRKQKSLLQLFHLGQWTENVDEIIDHDILDILVGMGFLEKEGERIKTKNYVICPYGGIYIIGQKWKPGEASAFNQVWLGEDSLCLARLLPAVRGEKVLDLCSGTGILGLIMASRGADVTAVEINPEAVKLCGWNIFMNHLEDTMRVYEGDLYKPVKGKSFDFILANPPYIPLIEDKETGLLFGSAGDDGLKLLRAVVYEAHEYLEPSGKAIMIAGGFGDDEKPFVSEELSDYAGEKGFLDINLMVYGKKKAMEELSHIEKVLPSVHPCYRQIDGSDAIRNRQYYHFILSIHRTLEPKGELHTIFCFSSLKDTFKYLKEGKGV
jgi:HemK-related putative methylase